MREYVLVDQEKVRVERFDRRGDDWVYTVFNLAEDILRLASVGCDIPLQRVYAKMAFPPQEEGRA